MTANGWCFTFWGMACNLRVEYPGAIYHGMNRGERREAVFNDGVDGEGLLETLGEAWARRAVNW
jgi:hypothetical protein